MMTTKTLTVKFVDNGSARWDGKVTDVPKETVVRAGRRGGDGNEQVEMHWPGKGKGGKVKVWHAMPSY